MKWLYRYVVPGCLGILAGWIIFSLKHEEAWSKRRMVLLHWHWHSTPVSHEEAKIEREVPKVASAPVKRISSVKKPKKMKPRHQKKLAVSQFKVRARTQTRKPASVRAKIDKAPEIKAITIEE